MSPNDYKFDLYGAVNRLTQVTDRGDLSDGEKKAYITAVQCLTSAPSKLNPTKYPGAKTRFDDFVAVHINQTLTIHGTVSLQERFH